ncbi:MAG: hypothetical protein HOM14_16855 [Gammaproteobacteria bacterium]|jgi:transcription elongation factor Elf1|nr:hypothetical protein [Gammaproteobacteria bacterium]MBT4196557.1 hypothetical protein [Gammaproteobacteria bacterium]MBT6553021.1 hypothetical protein [Gammaproteobacteria bacterium]MBT6703296.1 hypothetical protein [Gammaproteobacteria bacterium]MBT7047947.1 hypothetical protein [Gammaproteobacteria bacterium]
MKCPHCNSLMNIYESTKNDKSQVSFYRCSICVAQHVSSSVVTTGQFYGFENQKHSISELTSHNRTIAMV